MATFADFTRYFVNIEWELAGPIASQDEFIKFMNRAVDGMQRESIVDLVYGFSDTDLELSGVVEAFTPATAVQVLQWDFIAQICPGTPKEIYEMKSPTKVSAVKMKDN